MQNKYPKASEMGEAHLKLTQDVASVPLQGHSKPPLPSYFWLLYYNMGSPPSIFFFWCSYSFPKREEQVQSLVESSSRLFVICCLQDLSHEGYRNKV